MFMSTADVALRYHLTPSIGLGHAARARTLTSELQAKGARVEQVVPEAGKDLLIGRGMSGESITVVESRAWVKLRQQVSHIVVDTLWNGNGFHTALEVHELKIDTGARIVVIDSMPPDHFTTDKSQYEPDLLVTPYYRAEIARTAPEHSEWLHGSKYAIIGTEFRDFINTPKDSCEHHRLLVCTGGSDADALSLRIVKALIKLHVSDEMQINIIIGPLYSEALKQELSDLASDRENFSLHWQPRSIAQLLHNATLITGRPGLIRYESACLGTPSLLLSADERYRDYYDHFNADGLAEIYFQLDNSGETDFMNRLRDLLQAKPQINDTGCGVIDGLGTQRIANAILSEPLRLEDI
ncbi:hypothetical protein N9383_02415 [Granulosicoccus sp.]|nr:hypothetical protein [Granulosicoccus sp.]